jgi:hypothetical protein
VGIWDLLVMGFSGFIGGRRIVGDTTVESKKRVIDVEQRVLLPLGQARVGEHGELHGPPDVGVGAEDPGTDVDLLRRARSG